MKNFKTLSKRGLALFLALMMCVSLLPATAMAAELNDLSADGRELICGKEAHSHTEECYETVSDLICGMEENHVHGEDCYVPGEPVLACASDEEGHVHTDACYVPSERVLICDAAEGHVHSEDCYTESKSETLICALEEHEHSEECYAPAEQETEVPETPEIVIPEGATLVDPAWLLAANPNAGKAMLSVWNLFGLVRDNYQDVLGGSFPETLTFVGETVNETVWYEDTQEYDPAVIRVTGDAIIYNGEPVTVYFQGVIEGVDEPELLKSYELNLSVGAQETLTKTNSSASYDQYRWTVDDSGRSFVNLSITSGKSTTVTGTAAGKATVRLQGSKLGIIWSDIDIFNITVNTSTDITITYKASYGGNVFPTSETVTKDGIATGAVATPNNNYAFKNWTNDKREVVSTNAEFVPVKPDSGYSSAAYTANFVQVEAQDAYFYILRPDLSSDQIDNFQTGENYEKNWIYVGKGTVTATPASENQAYAVGVSTYPAPFPTITFEEHDYTYDATGTAPYTYSIDWVDILAANGANRYDPITGKNETLVAADKKCWHVDGIARLRTPGKFNVTFKIWDVGTSGFEIDKFQINSDKVNAVSIVEEGGTVSLVPVHEATKVVDGVTYTFDGWYTNNESCSGVKTIDPKSYVIREDTTFYAKYIARYMVTTRIDQGTITGGGNNFNQGDSTTVTWVPAANYHVTKVTVDGVEQENPALIGGSVTFDDISENHSIVVETAIDTYIYTVNYHYDEAIVTESGEAEFGSEIPYSTISPITYEGHNYVLDDVVVTSATVTADVADNVVDVYYNLDEKGPNGEESDGTADKYQVEVTFTVRNGYWSNLRPSISDEAFAALDEVERGKYSTPQHIWLTKLDAAGNPAIDGTATVTFGDAPAVGRLPYNGYAANSGAWDPALTAEAPVKITEPANFTYTYQRGAYAYRVNYYYDGVLAPAETETGTGTYEESIPYDDSTSRTYNGRNYMLENIVGKDKKISYVVADNVVELYYTLDQIGPNGGSDGTPDKYQITVNYRAGANGTVTGDTTKVITLRNDAGNFVTSKTMIIGTEGVSVNAASGYTFSAWSGNPNANQTVTGGETYTFTASFTTSYIPTDPVFPPPDPGPGPGGGTTTIPENPTPLGPDPDGTTTILDEEVPLANAVGLNITDHFAYIIGYEDDTVRPLKNITRAEAVTIFFRLMEDDYRAANWSMENPFRDVNAGNWHNNAVSTCLKAGALKHFAQDAAFLPNQAITRAEFASIAAGFVSDEITGESIGDFSDTEGHWAAADIRKAVEAGWIKGVGGNRFAPDETITRAEVMTIVNRMLDRVPDAEHMLPDMKKWLDNPEDAWYYEAVQEATNEHDYDVDEFGAESWTEILKARDWKSLENEWANNGGMSAPAEPVKPEEGTEGEGEAEDAGSEAEKA